MFVDDSIVWKLKNLQPRGLPRQIVGIDGKKAAGLFNANAYFLVLKHVRMKDGYELDYIYRNSFLGGYPCLYARPSGEEIEPKDNECMEWEEGKLGDYFIVDGTPDGFFELAVLLKLKGQFYLSWHGEYDDTRIVTKNEEMERIIEKINGGNAYKNIGEEDRMRIAEIDKAPTVELLEDRAAVTYCLFTEWGGFSKVREYYRKSAPHRIIKSEIIETVDYDCGIVF